MPPYGDLIAAAVQAINERIAVAFVEVPMVRAWELVRHPFDSIDLPNPARSLVGALVMTDTIVLGSLEVLAA
jgi:hypothetical protein